VIGTTPRYRGLVKSFHCLAALDTDYTELISMQAEAEQGLAAEGHLTQSRAAQSRDQSAPQGEASPARELHSVNGNGRSSAQSFPKKVSFSPI
jgi:hypothetical protein